jgi:hypothetical protein
LLEDIFGRCALKRDEEEEEEAVQVVEPTRVLPEKRDQPK